MTDAEAKLRRVLETEEIVAGIHGDVSWAVREVLEDNERLSRCYRESQDTEARALEVRLEAAEKEVEASRRTFALNSELRRENERLRGQALSMTVYAQGQEARIEAALALHYCAFDVSHTEAFDDATCACGAEWTRDGCQSPTVKALKGERER